MIYERIEDEFGYVYIKATQEDGKILSIPLDSTNSDYQAYLKWTEENNEQN
jgi:hypothetical protein